MAFTRSNLKARTSSAGNPISTSITVAAGTGVVVVLLKATGATNRAGGSPTFGPYTMTQANSTQKAVTTPEASAEAWYVLNPPAGTYTLTVPNTGALTCFYTVEAGIPAGGGSAAFMAANGGNNTSTNPTPGAITVTDARNIVWAITAGGWTTWAPSAQAGTVIANTDDGADGGGEQYVVNQGVGSFTLNWTFATSDDWGAVVAGFFEVGPHNIENYKGIKVGDGMGTGEKIR